MRKIPARAALDEARKNQFGRWKKGAGCAAERLASRVCIPWSEPTFQITDQKSIFAIGANFARNFEDVLAVHHGGVRSDDINLPGAEDLPGRIANVVNKYDAVSMMQELMWAVGQGNCPDEAYLLGKSGALYDPHLRRHIGEAPLDVLKRRRAAVTEYFTGALDAALIIIALEVSEAWTDEKTGLVLNEPPELHNIEQEPDRFTFGALDVADNLRALEHIHDLVALSGNATARFVVMVSPTPISRSFSTRDVVLANTLAKANLRIAIQKFAHSRKNVEYFPVYEAAMISDRRLVWHQDRFELSGFMMGQLVSTFIRRHGYAVPIADIPEETP